MVSDARLVSPPRGSSLSRHHAGTLEILRASCSFCNSMTLPLVFLASLLRGGAATRSFGYVALYQLAWSPLLWSLGPRMLHVDGVTPLLFRWDRGLCFS